MHGKRVYNLQKRLAFLFWYTVPIIVRDYKHAKEIAENLKNPKREIVLL